MFYVILNYEYRFGTDKTSKQNVSKMSKWALKRFVFYLNLLDPNYYIKKKNIDINNENNLNFNYLFIFNEE